MRPLVTSGSVERLRPAARTVLLTAAAMLAFASNSLLCRLALRDAQIDAASFGSLRLVSGALMLAIVVRAGAGRPPPRADWLAAAMLFAYVACFSFAYLSVSAATGALILFGGNPRRHRARARQPRARENRAAGAASARHAGMNAGRGPLYARKPAQNRVRAFRHSGAIRPPSRAPVQWPR